MAATVGEISDAIPASYRDAVDIEIHVQFQLRDPDKLVTISTDYVTACYDS